MLSQPNIRSPVQVPLSATGSGPLPGSTNAVERYLASLGPAYAPKTTRSLASDWTCFARWCAEVARMPFPAAPATVIAYLEAQAPSHTVATLRRRLATLSHLHDALGAANPTRDTAVRLSPCAVLPGRGARAPPTAARR